MTREGLREDRSRIFPFVCSSLSLFLSVFNLKSITNPSNKLQQNIFVAEQHKINWIIVLTIVAKATLIQLARTSAVPRVKSRLKPRKPGSNKLTSHEGESREYNNMHFIHHRVLQRNLKLLQTSSESKDSSTTEVLTPTVHQSSFIQRKVKTR